MKKIILLFTLIFTVVGGTSAKTNKLYASSGTVASNASWTPSSNTFGWTATNSNQMVIFSFSAGTLSNYTKLVLDIQDITNNSSDKGSKGGYRIFIGKETSTNLNEDVNIETTGNAVELTLSDISGLTSDEIATATWIKISGPNGESDTYWNKATCTLNLANCYLETDEFEGIEITTTLNSSTTSSSPFQWYTSSDGSNKTDASGSFYRKQFDQAGIKEIIALAGSSLGYGNGFFDVTGYNNVKVNVSSYDNAKDNEIRLLATSGASSTTNFTVSLKEAEANIKSLSAIESYWLSGIFTKANSSNSQNISSIAFTKNFNAEGATAFNVAASKSSTVSYDRSFTAHQMSTVCLPFALTETEVTAAGTFYELTGYDGTTLTFAEVTETDAYKPYVFEANADGKPFSNYTDKAIEATPGTYSYQVGSGTYTATFQGTLASGSVPDGAYGYNATGGTFSKASGSGVSINAFRAYITVSGVATARSLDTDFGDGTTGIEKVKNVGNKYDSIYNLSGQSVSPNYKGIVIKNGKKMIQK